MQQTDDTLERLTAQINDLEAQIAALRRRMDEQDERIRHLNNVTIVVTSEGIRLERHPN